MGIPEEHQIYDRAPTGLVDDPTLVTARRGADYLTHQIRYPITDGTIRNWASDGLINRYGKRGMANLYAAEELHEVAEWHLKNIGVSLA